MYGTADASDFDTGQTYTEYILRCTWGETSETAKPWMVARRFREYYALDSILRAVFPHLADHLPPLPAKAMFGSLAYDTVRARQSQLETYVQRLLTDQPLSPIVTSPQLDEFLMITDRLKQIKGGVHGTIRGGAPQGQEQNQQIHDSLPSEPGSESFLPLPRGKGLLVEDAQQIFERTSPVPLTDAGLTEMEANVVALHSSMRNMRAKSAIGLELKQLIEKCRMAWPRLKATGDLEGNPDLSLVQRALQCDEDLTRLAATVTTVLAIKQSQS
jgi:hypothetical protein